MISQQKINEAAELLMSSVSVRKVILFGSYASGDVTEDSDVDFLVVETDVPSKVQEMVRLRRIIRHLRLPVDVMVVSENDLEDWGGSWNYTLLGSERREGFERCNHMIWGVNFWNWLCEIVSHCKCLVRMRTSPMKA